MLYKAEIFGKDPRNPEKVYYITADNIADATTEARVKLNEENPNSLLRVRKVEEAKGDISQFQIDQINIDEDIEKEKISKVEIATRALSDAPSTTVDLLGFSDYAVALTDFISNEKTEKPLTIGIDAPWGMGKTTLMKMINASLLERGTKREKGQTFKTVWFNAWKYDQEESLWAALALEILNQIRGQSKFCGKTELWLKLNFKRVEWKLFIWDNFKVLGKLALVFFLGLIGLRLLEYITNINWLESYSRIYVQYGSAVGILGWVSNVGRELHKRITGPFDLNIAKYIRDPDYKNRIGFIGQFEEDFKKVIESVTQEGKRPLVIFIDDLDRCAPPKPVEIIEAINILLDAKHCVFVIGMDAKTIAASIETKYKDLRDSLETGNGYSELNLGQRFLEKIIQINFRLPKVIPSMMEEFIKANLSHEKELKTLENSEKEIKEIEERKEDFARTLDDSEEVKKAILKISGFLDYNPRKTKRFINNFRLQALIANRKGLFARNIITLDTLAKTVIIATRWPFIFEQLTKRSGLIAQIKTAQKTKSLLDELQPKAPLYSKYKKEYDNWTSDPDIERALNIPDFLRLINEMAEEEIDTFDNYLNLADFSS